MESDFEFEEKIAFPVKIESTPAAKKHHPLNSEAPLSEVINKFNTF